MKLRRPGSSPRPCCRDPVGRPSGRGDPGMCHLLQTKLPRVVAGQRGSWMEGGSVQILWGAYVGRSPAGLTRTVSPAPRAAGQAPGGLPNTRGAGRARGGVRANGAGAPRGRRRLWSARVRTMPGPERGARGRACGAGGALPFLRGHPLGQWDPSFLEVPGDPRGRRKIGTEFYKTPPQARARPAWLRARVSAKGRGARSPIRGLRGRP